jgi:peptidoglycan/LPS O-acetylase OafA/YrhL
MTRTSPNPPARGPHLPRYLELDGVRGLAALAVLFHHVLYVNLDSPQHWDLPVRALHAVAARCNTGVDLFFVLSGFLITSLLLRDRESPAFYHDFYWKRVLRILPVCLLTLAVILLLFERASLPYVLCSLFFVSNFAGQLHVASFGPFWSLAIEEQFYLLWPTLVRRPSVKAVERLALFFWVLPNLLRFAAASIGHFDYYLTPLRIDGLAAGAFFACRIFAGRNARMESRNAVVWLLVSVPFLVAGSFSALPLAWAAALFQTGVSLAAPGLVALTVLHTGAPAFGWLRSRLLLFYGLISYALYMLHIYVINAFERWAPRVTVGNDLALLAFFAGVLGVSTLLCVLTRYAIELPAMSLRRFVLSRLTAPPETG